MLTRFVAFRVATAEDRALVEQIELRATPEVRGQQSIDPHAQPCLLEDLPRQAVLGCLSIFQPTAWQPPWNLPTVGVLQHQDLTVVVLDQRHGTDHERWVEHPQEHAPHPTRKW